MHLLQRGGGTGRPGAPSARRLAEHRRPPEPVPVQQRTRAHCPAAARGGPLGPLPGGTPGVHLPGLPRSEDRAPGLQRGRTERGDEPGKIGRGGDRRRGPGGAPRGRGSHLPPAGRGARRPWPPPAAGGSLGASLAGRPLAGTAVPVAARAPRPAPPRTLWRTGSGLFPSSAPRAFPPAGSIWPSPRRSTAPTTSWCRTWSRPAPSSATTSAPCPGSASSGRPTSSFLHSRAGRADLSSA